MILRRLQVHRFLGVRDASFEFAPGINVIVGPNEAGKSTLRAAIHTVLYGNPATTSPARRGEFLSWGATDPPILILEFEVDGQRFVLTKDFASRKLALTDETGRTWDQHRVVQERIAAQLGLATEDLYQATAHVAQAELERIHLSSIAKELGRIIGGGGEDVAQAIRKLDLHVRALEKGSKGQLTKDPGLLRALEEKVTGLREEQQRLVRSAGETDRARIALLEIRQTRTRAGEELASKHALLERNREILQIEERLAALRREEAMLEEKVTKIEETLDRLAAIDRELETATIAGVPDEEVTRAVSRQHERLTILEAEAARLHRELTETPRTPPVHTRRWWAVVASGVVVATIGVVLATRMDVGVGGGLAIAGALGALAGLWAIHRIGNEHQRSIVRHQARQERMDALEQEGASERVQLQRRLTAIGCRSVQEAQERVRRYRDLVRDRAQVASFLEDLRAGTADETIADRWKTVRLDMFGLQERLASPEVAVKRMTPLQVQALEREVEHLAKEVAGLEERERRLTWDLERLAVDTEVLASVEERLVEAEEALEGVRRRQAVYREALQGLLEARRRAEVPVRNVMEKRAGDYLRILSDGRYSRLQAEPETLRLLVWADEAGGWVDASEPHLSRGTVDLVYLSARLALVSVLTAGKRPPLLFDDPFITFDEQRRAASAALLRELSRAHQVFLFTYTRHYDRDADRMIELPERITTPQPEAEPEVPSVGPLWEYPQHK